MPTVSVAQINTELSAASQTRWDLRGDPPNLVAGVKWALQNGLNRTKDEVTEFFDSISGLSSGVAARIVALVDPFFVNYENGLAKELFIIGTHAAKITSSTGVAVAQESGAEVWDFTNTAAGGRFTGSIPPIMFHAMPGITCLHVLKPIVPPNNNGGYFQVWAPGTSNINHLLGRTRTNAGMQFLCSGYRTVTGSNASSHEIFAGDINADVWCLLKRAVDYGEGTAAVSIDGTEIGTDTFTGTGVSATLTVPEGLFMAIGGDLDGPNFVGRKAMSVFVSGGLAGDDLDDAVENLILPRNPQYTPPE